MKSKSSMENSQTKGNLSDYKENQFWARERIDEFFADRALYESVRRGSCRPMVSHIILAKFYQLLEKEKRALKDIFSTEEIIFMVRYLPIPKWADYTFEELIFEITDTIYYGYMEEKFDRPGLASYYQKVQGLSDIQRIALADLLECAYHRDNPEDYIINETKESSRKNSSVSQSGAL